MTEVELEAEVVYLRDLVARVERWLLDAERGQAVDLGALQMELSTEPSDLGDALEWHLSGAVYAVLMHHLRRHPEEANLELPFRVGELVMRVVSKVLNREELFGPGRAR